MNDLKLYRFSIPLISIRNLLLSVVYLLFVLKRAVLNGVVRPLWDFVLAMGLGKGVLYRHTCLHVTYVSYLALWEIQALGVLFGDVCMNILAYADDMVVLAPSWHALPSLLNVLHLQSVLIDMNCNVNKTVCKMFKPNYYYSCSFPASQNWS